MSQNNYVHTNNIDTAAVANAKAAISTTVTITPGPLAIPDSLVGLLQAALVAEDIASAFYYTGLTSPNVIQDSRLAGTGGMATMPNSTPGASNVGNIAYLRAALYQEISHATQLRQLLNANYTYSQAAYAHVYDPYQTIYFNPNSFSCLYAFLTELDTLEKIFIGAYHVAVEELTVLAFNSGFVAPHSGNQAASFYAGAAQLAARVMFVEGEHRMLGKVILQDCNVLTDYEDGNRHIDALTGLNDMNSAQSLLLKYVVAGTDPNYTQGVYLGNVIAGASSIWIATS